MADPFEKIGIYMDLETIRSQLRHFSKERDWEQFHSPKNLIMALSNEVGELTELFQWLTEQQSYEVMDDPVSAAQVKGELADVLLYLIRMADVLNVDLVAAAKEKLELNHKRFPIEKIKGRPK
jgi:NTP pyrophosphatase (non-canonical NTP hydrolase)